LQSQPICFVLEKKEMIHNDTFVYSDHGHAKVNKPRENEAKTRRCRDIIWLKKGMKSHFEYKLHSANRRDYELIKKFKTMTALLRNSRLDLSE
jgi:transposase, IS5 family